jgi:hypothetical protein
MILPVSLCGGPAAHPAANDDKVPEGAPGCACTLPGVPSAFCRFHGEGAVCPESLRAFLLSINWPILPGLIDYTP